MDSQKIIATCPKRRTSKNSYGSNISVFQCFCGKKYMSYPALYLHAKIKHNLKINSKDYEAIRNQEAKEEQQSQAQNDSKSIEIFGSPVFNFENKELIKIEFDNAYNTLTKYLTGQKNRNNYIKSEEKTISMIQACKEYLDIMRQCQLQAFKMINMLLYLLTQCINGNFIILDERFKTMRDPKFIYVIDGDCQMVPQFFNFYSVIYLPTCLVLNKQILRKSGLSQKTRVLFELKKFADWLHQKKYTQQKVEMSEQWLQIKNSKTIKK